MSPHGGGFPFPSNGARTPLPGPLCLAPFRSFLLLSLRLRFSAARYISLLGAASAQWLSLSLSLAPLCGRSTWDLSAVLFSRAGEGGPTTYQRYGSSALQTCRADGAVPVFLSGKHAEARVAPGPQVLITRVPSGYRLGRQRSSSLSWIVGVILMIMAGISVEGEGFMLEIW